MWFRFNSVVWFDSILCFVVICSTYVVSCFSWLRGLLSWVDYGFVDCFDFVVERCAGFDLVGLMFRLAAFVVV